VKSGSRIFNRTINGKYFASYLDRGRVRREYRWLREECRKLNGLSLQEVLNVNNIPSIPEVVKTEV
jgi:hypothetical protein